MDRRRMMMGKGWDGVIYKEGESKIREPFENRLTTYYGDAMPHLTFLNPNRFEEGFCILTDKGDYTGLTIGAVDFTGFKTLNIECRRVFGDVDPGNYFYCGYSDSFGVEGSRIPFEKKAQIPEYGKTTFSFDIASVSGKKYIAFEIAAETIGVYNIWLE